MFSSFLSTIQGHGHHLDRHQLNGHDADHQRPSAKSQGRGKAKEIQIDLVEIISGWWFGT